VGKLGFNIWKYADMWNNYGQMAIWGPMIITQALAMAGIAAEINEIVYYMGAGLVALFHSVIYMGMVTYAMIMLWSTNSNAANTA